MILVVFYSKELYLLTIATLTLSLPGNTTVKTEFSQTESIFDISNTFTPKKDTGWLIEVDSHPTDNLLLSAYYRNIGDYFDNPSAIDVMRGTEKYGFEAILKADETTWLKATYFDEKDTLNNMKHQFGSIGAGKKIGKTTIEAEFYRETATDNYVSPSSPSSREPFDFSEDTPEEATGAKVRIEQQLNSKVSVLLEHKQNFLADEGTATRAGIDYKIDDTRKAYLRQEYGHFEDRKEMRTALGVEADLTPSTSAFNEYRLSGGIDGNNSQQSIGLRNKFNLADNITGNVSVENLTTLSGKERQSQPDAFAAALGLEYLPKDDLKITSRFEHRRQTSERSNLAELSIATMLNPEYSFMLRQRLFYNSFIGGGEQITARTLLGTAYRPITNNKFNALARLEFKVDKNTNSSPSYNETSYIGSVEGNYQFNSKTQFTGKYAGKLTNDADISSYSDLISGRLLHDITDRFDLGLELRLLNSYDTGTSFIGGSAEIGYRVVKDLWFSLGYSFDSFDQDLTGSTYSGKGPYIMLRFKLDENLFK
ncbi:hypothetical protein M0P98_01075 [bacterium]|nr:hypothetical protein [bacterium]